MSYRFEELKSNFLVCILCNAIWLLFILGCYDKPSSKINLTPTDTEIELIAETEEHAKVYRIKNPKTIVPVILVVGNNGNHVAIR